MSKQRVKPHFWAIRGKKDEFPVIFYGIEPPYIDSDGSATGVGRACTFFGGMQASPLPNKVKVGSPAIKVYIRFEKQD